jgi:hypothetical protein
MLRDFIPTVVEGKLFSLPGCSGFPNPELNISRISNPDIKSSGQSVLIREIRG